jgi:hypothetical protein
VATRSLKRGAVWRIDFKKKGDFRQKIWQSRLLALFRQKKKEGLLCSSMFLKGNLFIFISKSGDPFPGRFSQIYLAINQK